MHSVIGEEGDGGLDVVGAEADVLQPGPGELSQEPAHTQLQRGGAGAWRDTCPRARTRPPSAARPGPA